MKKLFLNILVLIFLSGCTFNITTNSSPKLGSQGIQLTATTNWQGGNCFVNVPEDWQANFNDFKAEKNSSRVLLLAQDNFGQSLESTVDLFAFEFGADSLISDGQKNVSEKQGFELEFAKTIAGDKRKYKVFGFQNQDLYCLVVFSANQEEFDSSLTDYESIISTLQAEGKAFGERTRRISIEGNIISFTAKQSPKIFEIGKNFPKTVSETDYVLLKLPRKNGFIEFKGDNFPFIDVPESLNSLLKKYKTKTGHWISFNFASLPDYIEEINLFTLLFTGETYFVESGFIEALDLDDKTTYYDLSLQGSNVLMKVSTVLDSEEQKINYWNISWLVPENTEIISIKDSLGEITEFTLNESNLEFQTNFGPARNQEKIEMEFLVKNAVKEEEKDLNLIEFPLAGSKDSQAKITVHVSNVLSVYSGFGFDWTIEEDKVLFEGQGLPFFRIFFSEKKSPYKHFVVFGNDSYDLSTEDFLFESVEKITGKKSPFKKFPIIILSDKEFEKRLEIPNPGVYQNGVIYLKESTFDQPYQTKKLNTDVLHEVAHGFTEQVIKWAKFEDPKTMKPANNSLAWLNEGISTYVEFALNSDQGRLYPNLFSNTPKQVTRGNLIINLPSAASEDDLWNYYHTTPADEMLTWYYDSPTIDIGFGYSFSELVMRLYIKKNGIDAIQTLYNKLSEVKEPVSSVEEANQKVLEIMQLENLRPCYSENRIEFSECIDLANRFIARIPE